MRLPRFLGLLLSVAHYAAAESETEFLELAKANGGYIKLDSKGFDALVAPDRNWSATIQLTALGSSFKCAPCVMFDPVFKTIAKAWMKAPEEAKSQHFFASLDFENGSEIFRRLGLNSAPFIYTYMPVKGPRASKSPGPYQFDFNNAGFDAQSFVDGLNRHTPVPIPYSPPRDWTPIIGLVFATLITIIGARFVMPILANKWLWALFSIATSLIMTSGFMFVRIRGNPYVAAGPGGKAQWIAGGYQNQFGMETQVVSFIYGLLSFSCISLVVFVPRIPSKLRQRLAIYTWAGIQTLVLAILLSFFRLKTPSYPFYLLL